MKLVLSVANHNTFNAHLAVNQKDREVSKCEELSLCAIPSLLLRTSSSQIVFVKGSVVYNGRMRNFRGKRRNGNGMY